MAGAGTPPLAEGLLRVDPDGPTLLGGRSRSSGLLHFPRAAVCPYTGADDVEDVDLPRRGTLWAWTVVSTAPPGHHGPVPYGFGVVELSDGGTPPVRVVGRLAVTDVDDVSFGDPMEVAAEELPDGEGGSVLTWCFVPVAVPEPA
jgi:uncharacterized OB-fold protein